MIRIAGPYRSGTNDDPDRMRENLERLESLASAVHAIAYFVATMAAEVTSGEKAVTAALRDVGRRS